MFLWSSCVVPVLSAERGLGIFCEKALKTRNPLTRQVPLSLWWWATKVKSGAALHLICHNQYLRQSVSETASDSSAERGSEEKSVGVAAFSTGRFWKVATWGRDTFDTVWRVVQTTRLPVNQSQLNVSSRSSFSWFKQMQTIDPLSLKQLGEKNSNSDSMEPSRSCCKHVHHCVLNNSRAGQHAKWRNPPTQGRIELWGTVLSLFHKRTKAKTNLSSSWQPLPVLLVLLSVHFLNPGFMGIGHQRVGVAKKIAPNNIDILGLVSAAVSLPSCSFERTESHTRRAVAAHYRAGAIPVAVTNKPPVLHKWCCQNSSLHRAVWFADGLKADALDNFSHGNDFFFGSFPSGLDLESWNSNCW